MTLLDDTPDLQEAVKLAGDIYDAGGCAWTHYYDAGSNHGVCYGVNETVNTVEIVFRGSKTIEDWFRDFKACSIEHPLLGGVEEGFAESLDLVFRDLLPILQAAQAAHPAGKRIRVIGHSLGAARALLFAGLLVSAGIVPYMVAAFAPPKPGFQKLAQVLDPIERVYSFRNGHDPVPELPLTLREFPYIQPRALITMRATPPGFADLIAWHSIKLYQTAILALILPPA